MIAGALRRRPFRFEFRREFVWHSGTIIASAGAQWFVQQPVELLRRGQTITRTRYPPRFQLGVDNLITANVAPNGSATMAMRPYGVLNGP